MVLTVPCPTKEVEGHALPPVEGGPPNCRGISPRGPTSPLLCSFMVAARLVTLLWHKDTRTQQDPHITNENMPDIEQAFFRTLNCLQ